MQDDKFCCSFCGKSITDEGSVMYPGELVNDNVDFGVCIPCALSAIEATEAALKKLKKEIKKVVDKQNHL